jgi:hypothetical protein
MVSFIYPPKKNASGCAGQKPKDQKAKMQREKGQSAKG